MAKKEYSAYQSDVIGHYYRNLDNIMLQKLGELVSELYLADSDTKKEKLWQRVNSALINLDIKPGLVKHVHGKKGCGGPGKKSAGLAGYKEKVK